MVCMMVPAADQSRAQRERRERRDIGCTERTWGGGPTDRMGRGNRSAEGVEETNGRRLI